MSESKKISFYSSELMLPFMRIKAELAEKYADRTDYYAALRTAERFIEAARDLINRKSGEETDD